LWKNLPRNGNIWMQKKKKLEAEKLQIAEAEKILQESKEFEKEKEKVLKELKDIKEQIIPMEQNKIHEVEMLKKLQEKEEEMLHAQKKEMAKALAALQTEKNHVEEEQRNLAEKREKIAEETAKMNLENLLLSEGRNKFQKEIHLLLENDKKKSRKIQTPTV